MKPSENLHVYPAPIVNASRIFKETLSAAQSSLFSRVIICGTAGSGLPREEALTFGRRIERVGAPVDERKVSVLARVWEQIAWSRSVYTRYISSDISVVNAHSVAVLPVCFLLSRKLGAKLIYDTHELETETSTSVGIQRRIFKAIERILIRKCDAVFVVNDSIAEWYRTEYEGVRPLAIRNIPGAQTVPEPVPLREILAVAPDQRLFIHVGNLTVARNIEAILSVFAAPAVGDHVVFLGDGQLTDTVRGYSDRHPNIHHLPAVSPDDVIRHVAGADVALCLIQPTCLSYRLSLPNKALEYALAGVPFFHTDLPEIRRLVEPALRDWCVDDLAHGLEAAILGLTDDQVQDARRGLAQLQLPNWDEEAAAMIARYQDIVSPGKVSA